MASFLLRSTSESAEPAGPDPPSGSIDLARRGEQARALCLRLLTTRARTRSELEAQLVKRGYPDELVVDVLDRFTDVGLVDDAGFAEQWVRSRRANDGRGKRALAAELRNRGVCDEVIDESLAGIDDGAERQRAGELVRAKLRRERLDEGDEPKVMRRLVGMLARRGYSSSLALDVVTGEWAAERQRRRV
jgi:regulatory protein